MKNYSFNKKNLKNILLRLSLIISIIFSIVIVNNCDFLTNFIDALDNGGGGGSHTPQFVINASSSFATSLFKSAAEGAAGEVGSSAASWVLGAIGLSDGSNDYSSQLNKIEQDLQVIISQLNGIQSQLQNISDQLGQINCNNFLIETNDETSRITSLMDRYRTIINTVSTGGIVTDSSLSDFKDRVLAQKEYAGSNKPMDEILSTIANILWIPASSSGTIPSCLINITPPVAHTFGTDTLYYNKVAAFIEYYYVYEAEALFLYSEAEHYQAWAAVGKPNSDSFSADSVSYVCSDKKAQLYCNLAATATNRLYNNLITQFTLGGATYTDDDLIEEYRSTSTYGGPFLWPKSLEDFTTAAGDHCSSPLTSGKPCGVAANHWNKGDLESVVYKGYSGWEKAGTAALQQLLDGWTSGTAGNYLQSKYNFKNMKNKIVMSKDWNYVTIYASHSYKQKFGALPFFDTDINYNFLQGVVSTGNQFEKLMLYAQHDGNDCSEFVAKKYHYSYYTPNANIPAARNGFYNLAARQDLNVNFVGTIKICKDFRWETQPGFYPGNTGSSGVQYQWPVLGVGRQACTENRSHFNIANVWTMCGDDFTAYLEFYVPRPQTCDNPGAGVPCNVSSQSIAHAKSIFGNNSKISRRY